MVRMGELAASKTAGDMLVTLGLGSCIGLVLLDRRMGVAGLAHVVLPESGGHTEVNQFKFADHFMTSLGESVGHHLAHERGVVDDENAGHSGHLLEYT